jgi:hypothetical protein
MEVSGGVPVVQLNNASLRFVAPSDGRGPGLSAVDLTVRDLAEVVNRARARGLAAGPDRVEICGVRFHLRQA